MSKKKTSKEIVLMMLFFGAFLLIFIFISFAGCLLLSLVSSSSSKSSLSRLFLVSRVSENSYGINSLLFSRRCILSSSHRSFARSHSLWLSSISFSYWRGPRVPKSRSIEMDASQRRRKTKRCRKVRAQHKWCADQNYGFEVWSKGLPLCNQRCDNRWAHRKCLIMSIIIMNGWQQQ